MASDNQRRHAAAANAASAAGTSRKSMQSDSNPVASLFVGLHWSVCQRLACVPRETESARYTICRRVHVARLTAAVTSLYHFPSLNGYRPPPIMPDTTQRILTSNAYLHTFNHDTNMYAVPRMVHNPHHDSTLLKYSIPHEE